MWVAYRIANVNTKYKENICICLVKYSWIKSFDVREKYKKVIWIEILFFSYKIYLIRNFVINLLFAQNYFTFLFKKSILIINIFRLWLRSI